MFNVLSLFDGISCGQLALKRAGIEYNNYFASEIDKHAIKITSKHFPNTIQLGNIKNWKDWNLPKIDLIFAGSPCQGFSQSGKGFNDDRSGLFYVFIDILRFYNPDWFLFENVKTKQKGVIEEITNQIGVNPININSNLVSGQNRNRLYWTNITGITLPENKNILLQDILESGIAQINKSYCLDANYGKSKSPKRIYNKIKKGITKFSQSEKRLMMVIDNNQYRRLSPIECERLQTIPDNYTQETPVTNRYKVIGNAWTIDVISHILSFINLPIDKIPVLPIMEYVK